MREARNRCATKSGSAVPIYALHLIPPCARLQALSGCTVRSIGFPIESGWSLSNATSHRHRWAHATAFGPTGICDVELEGAGLVFSNDYQSESRSFHRRLRLESNEMNACSPRYRRIYCPAPTVFAASIQHRNRNGGGTRGRDRRALIWALRQRRALGNANKRNSSNLEDFDVSSPIHISSLKHPTEAHCSCKHARHQRANTHDIKEPTTTLTFDQERLFDRRLT